MHWNNSGKRQPQWEFLMKACVLAASMLLLKLELAWGGKEQSPPEKELSDIAIRKCEEGLLPDKEQRIGEVTVLAADSSQQDANYIRQRTVEFNKVAHELGMATPDQVLVLTPSNVMKNLASVGGHATPYWWSGYKVLNGMRRAGSILEFVSPYWFRSMSYYDAYWVKDQITRVVAHVFGHNDIGTYLTAHRISMTDYVANTFQLAERVSELYSELDPDEVAHFLFLLEPLIGLQDYQHASFIPPEAFVSGSPEYQHYFAANPEQPRNGSTAAASLSPPRPVANVLQYLVKHLPPEAPPWQKELIEKFEKSWRWQTGLVAGQVMIEGWASFSEYVLAKHHPELATNVSYLLEMMSMDGIHHSENFAENPYWLGLQIWLRLYDKFKDRPDIQNLDPKAQDIRFIAYAHEVMAKYTDHQFVALGLDDTWWQQEQWFLFREATPDEMAERGVAPRPDARAMIALSRDPERLTRFVQRLRTVPHLKRAQVILHTDNWQQRGWAFYEHRVAEDIPLVRREMYLGLFGLAELQKRPILFKTEFMRMETAQNEDQFQNMSLIQYYSMLEQNPHAFDPQPRLIKQPVYILVEPSGDARVHQVAADGRLGPELIKHSKHAMHVIKQQQSQYRLVYNADFVKSRLMPRWEPKYINAVVDGMAGSARGETNYAPFAERAVASFLQLIEVGVPQMLRRLIQQGQTLPRGATGVGAVNLLPRVGGFYLDRGFRARWQQASLDPAPVDTNLFDPVRGPVDQDDLSRIAKGRFLPGEIFFYPERDQNGSPTPEPGQGQDQSSESAEDEGEGEEEQAGEGDGEGEGDEDGQGQPKPGEGDGDKQAEDTPGPGSGGVSVPIPDEYWGQLLAEELELPNLRRTNGKAEQERLIRMGSVHRPQGVEITERTLEEALVRARALRKRKGLPYKPGDPGFDPLELNREALRMQEPSDVVVADRRPLPLPDYDAVLVVVMDMTGSMSGERIRMAKDLVFNVSALLKAQYPKVARRFVGFSDDWREFEEQSFFGSFIGGGTSYVAGLTGAKNILEEYPTHQYNKFVLVIGDGETYDAPQCLAMLREWVEELQFFSLAVTTGGVGFGNLGARFASEFARFRDNEWPYVGVSELKSRNDVVPALKELFPKVEQ